jgi:pimeloyl-ACP methyl ester carboxylesterase
MSINVSTRLFDQVFTIAPRESRKIKIPLAVGHRQLARTTGHLTPMGAGGFPRSWLSEAVHRIATNGVELAYDQRGSGPPILLVMGIGAQMLLWPEEFVEALARRGHRVVRFDHRDVGLSTWLDGAPVPDPRRSIAALALGLQPTAPYSLSDMASDTVGLLTGLDIDAAHVVGASMGGMIAQTIAIEHPTRLRSLTSLMSTPGGLLNTVGHPRALKALLAKGPTTPDEAAAYFVAFTEAVSGDHRSDPVEVAALGAQLFERGRNPRGFLRHLGAIAASGDRRAALAHIRVPTLVLHGTQDPLIPPRAGRATASAIQGARLELIDGMGHTLPRAVWPQLLDAIAAHVRSAEASAGR